MMTPDQIAALGELRQELNRLYLKADALARRLELAKERPHAQTMREVMAYLTQAEDAVHFAIAMGKSEGRAG